MSTNWLALGLATTTSFLIGGVWYSFPLTATPWVNGMKQYLSNPNFTHPSPSGWKHPNGFTKLFGWELAVCFVRAFVLNHVLHLLHVNTLVDALKVRFVFSQSFR